MDQSAAPLHEELEAYLTRSYTGFHTPGHNGGRGINMLTLARLDLTEVPLRPGGPLIPAMVREAEELAADLFGAGRTFFLTNGASAGILAMLMGSCPPGASVAIGRDCHRSVVNACVLGDLKPRFLIAERLSPWPFPLGVAVEDARRELAAGHIVLITNPTYQGVVRDLRPLGGAGGRLLVDEAHGSHLIFGTYRGAGAAHAAAWVHGSHKTLGSLTQTGMLHLGMGVPEEPYALCLERIDSTSRSYPLLASLDLARQWAARHGRDAWENAAGRMDGLRRILSGAGLTILDESRLPADASPDPAKLTVAAPAGGFHAAGKLLRDHGLQCEAAGPDWLCLLVTPFHTDEELERLVPALTDAIAPTREGRGCCAGWPERLPVRVFWPREAVLRPRRRMALTAAENMVAADPLCPYPPGIPLVWPGEIIDRDTVEYVKAFLAAGGTVTGVDAAGEAAVVAEV